MAGGGRRLTQSILPRCSCCPASAAPNICADWDLPWSRTSRGRPASAGRPRPQRPGALPRHQHLRRLAAEGSAVGVESARARSGGVRAAAESPPRPPGRAVGGPHGRDCWLRRNPGSPWPAAFGAVNTAVARPGLRAAARGSRGQGGPRTSPTPPAGCPRWWSCAGPPSLATPRQRARSQYVKAGPTSHDDPAGADLG
jgi:hypothetical protein